MTDVLAEGKILVEIMRNNLDVGLYKIIIFKGSFL
jgi:hypothetical protein